MSHPPCRRPGTLLNFPGRGLRLLLVLLVGATGFFLHPRAVRGWGGGARLPLLPQRGGVAKSRLPRSGGVLPTSAEAAAAAAASSSAETETAAPDERGLPGAQSSPLAPDPNDMGDTTGDVGEAKPPPSTESPLSTAEPAQRRLVLLDQALKEFNSTSARQLLRELAEVRASTSSSTTSNKSSSSSSTSTGVEDVLDQLLEGGPDKARTSPSPGFNVGSIASSLYNRLVRHPVARVLPARWSRRARMASLRRALDYSTPPPNEGADSDSDLSSSSSRNDFTADERRRRRRALVSLLRTLARPVDFDDGDDVGDVGDEDSQRDDVSDPYRGGVAIRYLERKAIRESRPAGRRRQQQEDDVDLTLRRPKGLETPTYTVLSVVRHMGNKVEIRRYEPYSVCTVSMTKPRPENKTATDAQVTDPSTGGARAFGALAGYLFGKNRQQQSMSMTTPVISQPQKRMQQQASGKAEDGKVMSFVLPSQYWTREGLASAPEPLEGSGVTLEYVEGGLRAVLMYGGYASQAETNQRKSVLLSALAHWEGWEAVPDEPLALAQYNDPFTPPWKRVNEVSVAVRSKSEGSRPSSEL
jgi:SOUL heme-binding protein